MKKHVPLAIAFCGLFLVSVSPAYCESGMAGYAGSYLKIGLGARAAGMGYAFTAISEGAEGIFFNPAGPAIQPSREAVFTYNSLTLDRRLMGASIMTGVRNEGVLGVSWLYSSVTNVPMRDSDRNPAGNMPNSNNVIGLSFAKKFSDYFAAGTNLKYLHSKLEDLAAFAIAVDLGAMVTYKKIGSAGLVISNLGSSFRWEDWAESSKEYEDKIPLRIRSGVSAYWFDEKLITAAEIEKDEKLDPVLRAGAEYWFVREVIVERPQDEDENDTNVEYKAERWFGLRAGYSDKSPTFGGTVYFPLAGMRGGLDYAYLSGKLGEGSYHMFSLRVAF